MSATGSGPTGKCFDQFKMRCLLNYGKCAMDIVAFFQVYTVSMIEMKECNCEKYSTMCFTQCYKSTSANC